MKSKKKQANPEIVVGDVAHKSVEPAETAPAQPYLGAVQPGFGHRKKVFVFVLLGVLMLASAGWLFTHREKKEISQEQKISDYYKATAGYYAEGNNIKDPSGNLKDEFTAPSFDAAMQLGDTYTAGGDYTRGLQAYLAAEKLTKEANYVLFISIGDNYLKLGKNTEAKTYYEKAKLSAQESTANEERAATLEGIDSKLKEVQ